MAKYRFKTEEEFRREGLWEERAFTQSGHPKGWEAFGGMNEYLGMEIPDEYYRECERGATLRLEGWYFRSRDYVKIDETEMGKFKEEIETVLRKRILKNRIPSDTIMGIENLLDKEEIKYSCGGDNDDLAGFPWRVVRLMLLRQFAQKGSMDINVFRKDRKEALRGFAWIRTPEGRPFWDRVIGDRDFTHFDERFKDAPDGELSVEDALLEEGETLPKETAEERVEDLFLRMLEGATKGYKAATDRDVFPPIPPAGEVTEIRVREIAEEVYDTKTAELPTLKDQLHELGIHPEPVTVTVKAPRKPDKKVENQHFLFPNVLKALAARVNVALVGPAGSGKTSMVHNAADALDLPFYSKSVSAQTGVHEFFGYQDANGNFVRTLFREAYEHGGVFLVDEFDAGNPNVLAALNQATANGSCAFPDRMVEKHKDFIAVMAGNTYGTGATAEYVGRNKIDAATLDRFVFIEVPYDETLEMALATNKEWCQKVQKYRGIAKRKKVKCIISPRATFNGQALIEAGMDEEFVLQSVVFKNLSEDEIRLLESEDEIPIA